MPTNTELIREARLQIESLQTGFNFREKELANFDMPLFREDLAVLKSRLDKLENHVEETDKRRWQFVYIFAGAVATLLVTVLVQLVLLPLVKK